MSPIVTPDYLSGAIGRCCSDAMPVTLTEVQRIPTSGARAVEPVRVGGRDLLAIPQLAKDVPDGPPGMNGGDSDTELLLLHRAAAASSPWATLPAPGGEDAEFFTIGDRSFLAVASIRTGAGPYQFATTSTIFEWRGDGFVPFQEVPTFAAKQWRHWQIGGRHFLGLAQGVIFPPGHAGRPRQDGTPTGTRSSTSGTARGSPSSSASRRGGPTTGTPSRPAASSSSRTPSTPARASCTAGTARRCSRIRRLRRESGRAFATFDDDGETYLVVACIAAPTRLLRWRTAQFTEVQVLDGLGAQGAGGGPLRRAGRCSSGSTSSSAPRPTPGRNSTPRSTSGTAASCTRSPRSRPAAAPTSPSSAAATATPTPSS